MWYVDSIIALLKSIILDISLEINQNVILEVISIWLVYIDIGKKFNFLKIKHKPSQLRHDYDKLFEKEECMLAST